MQRALLASLLLGPLCALLGVFVTARRMAFFSDTISHAGLAGIALGFWWGFADPTLPLIGFSILIAAALLWIKQNTTLVTDTIMAILLSGSVALGIVIMSLLKGYQGEIHRYLFGDILAISWNEIGLCLFLFVVICAWLLTQLSSLTLLTAHEEMAHVAGIRVQVLNYLFVLVLTLTVAMSIRLLGIILVTSLLVVPAASARNLTGNLRQHLVTSFLLGLLSAVGGTLFSYMVNVPCGPAIVLTSISVFLASLVFMPFRHAKARSGV